MLLLVFMWKIQSPKLMYTVMMIILGRFFWSVYPLALLRTVPSCARFPCKQLCVHMQVCMCNACMCRWWLVKCPETTSLWGRAHSAMPACSKIFSLSPYCPTNYLVPVGLKLKMGQYNLLILWEFGFWHKTFKIQEYGRLLALNNKTGGLLVQGSLTQKYLPTPGKNQDGT